MKIHSHGRFRVPRAKGEGGAIRVPKIAILGFGREGQSLLRFLKKSPEYKNAEIWILDKNPKAVSKVKGQGSNVNTGEDYLKNIGKFDIVFRSPGIPYMRRELIAARKRGVKFSSSTKLFFEYLRGTTRNSARNYAEINKNITIIGVTGTKGKGTTATLIYKILKSCGKKVYLAGNIGKPALEILPKISVDQRTHQRKSASIAILELSSFQLQDLVTSPHIAVVLNIFPDHMDAHKSFSEYLNAKSSITKFQNSNDRVFYFADNKWARWIAQKSPGKKIAVRIGSANSRELEKVIKIPGVHNLKNILMAMTITQSLGCPKEKIIKVIKKFRGNEHRLELVRIIRRPEQTIRRLTQKIIPHGSALNPRKSATYWYDDSASTNPQTAAAAVLAFKEPTILIAGGRDKNLNYSPLARALKKSNTKLVILFGENKKKIYKEIRNGKLEIRIVKDLRSAVNLAYKTAKKLTNLKTYELMTIIFSPASASFDMFQNYAERGKKFKELVRKLN